MAMALAWCVLAGGCGVLGVSYLVRRRTHMLVVGVTGGIGVGKSCVAKALHRLLPRSHLIESDEVAHSLQLPGMPAWSAILTEFGHGRPSHDDPLLAPDWTINRTALGAIVFKHKERRAALDRIMRWPLATALLREVAVAFLWHGMDTVVIESALVFESGLSRFCDYIVCVSCDHDTRVGRIMNRDCCSREEALLRVASQMPQAEKEARAHVVVRSDRGDAEAQVQAQAQALALRRARRFAPTRASLLLGSVVVSVLACSYLIGDVFMRFLKFGATAVLGA